MNRQDLEVAKWNHAVESSQDLQITALAEYLDVVCSGWVALVVDDYKWVMPIPTKRLLGFRYAVQPVFTHQGGLLGRGLPSASVRDSVKQLLDSKFVYARVHLNSTLGTLGRASSNEQRLTHYLELNQTYDMLAANYRKDTRTQLARARLAGIVTCPIAPAAVIDHFKKHVWPRIPELRKSDFDRLNRLLTLMSHHLRIESYGAFAGDELCATALFIIRKNKAIYLLASMDRRFKRSGASRLLIDDFLRKHSSSSILLDFEGSMAPGVSSFYRSFGAQPRPIPLYVHFDNAIIKSSVELKRRLWQLKGIAERSLARVYALNLP